MPRPFARRLRRSNEPALGPAAAGASARLRRRVLGSVRGGTTRRPHIHAQAQRWAIAGGVVVVAAIALIAAVDLGRGAPAYRTVSAHLQANTMHALLRRFDTGDELIVWGMPEPPIGEVYEVWLDHAGGPPQPTEALFTVTSAGQGTVEVPGPLLGVREVMVTSEPLGGSSAPTSAAVLRLRVGHAH